jgi:hypothetical protein
VSPVKYELGLCIPEDILHSHCRENLKSYKVINIFEKHVASTSGSKSKFSQETDFA